MGVTTQAPATPAVARPTWAERWIRPLGWASLVMNGVLVVTGGAVRLTDSGLGCPTWPHCTAGSFTPHRAMGIHSAIEFGNRMLTFVLAAVAIATFVAAWRYMRLRGRRDLMWLALAMGLFIPLQAVVGGISVLTELNPWVVSLHLIISMGIIGVAVVFLFRLSRRTQVRTRPGPVGALGWATFVSAWLVLYAGTVVTGSGPHAGDAKSPRNGLDGLEVSQLHADLVFLFVGLTIGLLFTLLATRAPASARRAAQVLLAIELSQGVIGYVQYFTGVPAVLVGFHMLGASLVSAAVTWVLLETLQTGASADVRA
ncbi:MAG TPA: COX15/CtaA family protein [Marmoricola sp.]|nr:COX15/CtaA family protein [Marmoricola sp.]